MTSVLIRKLTENRYQLITAHGVSEGTLPELCTGPQAILPGHSLTLLLDAENCTLKRVKFAEHERKLLNKVIPYSLEDDLADRVDDIHFSIMPSSDKTADPIKTALVCYLNKAFLSEELDAFNEYHIDVQACFAEINALPCQAGQWSIVFPDTQRCLIRCADGEGISCHHDNLDVVLQTLFREKIVPEKVRLYISTKVDSDDIQAFFKTLPALKAATIETVQQEYPQLLWQCYSSMTEGVNKGGVGETGQGREGREGREGKKGKEGKYGGRNEWVNLLTGPFAPRLPWGKWWQQWKMAAILIIAIGLLDTGTRLVEINKLENLKQQLAEETEDSFRQVIPEGVLVDPVLQLQRRLASLQGNGSSGFIALLDRAAPVIMNNPDLEIQNINYSERDREIQMTLITRDFNTAESVRADLQRLGLQAELIGSTSSTEGNRSRLRIGS